MYATKHKLLLAVLYINISLFSQTLSLVKDINTGPINNSFPHYLLQYNNKLHFVAGDGSGHKLWSSDGTSQGTSFVGPILPANGIVRHLTACNGKLFFSYDDGVNGLELWVSDGTTSGTYLLKDIWPGNLSSNPQFFTVCNGKLFFQASTATRSQGLWVTDGTVNGTSMVGNQYASPFGSTSNFIVLNTKIYFEGNAGSGYGLWESDGTNSGTQQLLAGTLNSGSSHAILGNKFYFSKMDQTNGSELWVSDGTTSGTQLLKDIAPGATGSFCDNFITHNNKVYFSANNGSTGTELWVSDGTLSGTYLLVDANPGSAGSSPQSLTSFNNSLFAFCYNGTERVLYSSDGTLSGTVPVKILSGTSSVPYTYVFNGQLLFCAGSGANSIIYSCNGSSNGTNPLAPTVTTYYNSGDNFLTYNNELFLPAFYQSQGLELCKLSSVTSLHENKETNTIPFYPNPASTSAFLITNELTLKDLQLYDSKGQAVTLSGNPTNSGLEINFTHLADGVYLLRSKPDVQTVFSKTIIVKH